VKEEEGDAFETGLMIVKRKLDKKNRYLQFWLPETGKEKAR